MGRYRERLEARREEGCERGVKNFFIFIFIFILF